MIGNQTISLVMKNMNKDERVMKDYENFYQELLKIRQETEDLNKNLPSFTLNKNATYDQKVKEAIGNNGCLMI